MTDSEKTQNRFLLVIPAYEESLRLPQYLEELLSQIQSCELTISILIVDDGSSRKEQEFLQDFIKKKSVQYSYLKEPVLLPQNKGKGNAIYTGWKANLDFDYLAFVDADGSISAKEVVRVMKYFSELKRPKPCFIGSRIKMLGRKIERHLFRHLIGRIYATLVSNLFALEVYDSQCGFKIVPSQAFKEIKDQVTESGFCFDVELLVLLRNSGQTLIEVPIDWFDEKGSKVSPLKDGILMFFQLIRLRAKLEVAS